MSLGVGPTGPKRGPPSMGRVQWRTAANPLHEGPVDTFMKIIIILYIQQYDLPQKVPYCL